MPIAVSMVFAALVVNGPAMAPGETAKGCQTQQLAQTLDAKKNGSQSPDKKPAVEKPAAATGRGFKLEGITPRSKSVNPCCPDIPDCCPTNK